MKKAFTLIELLMVIAIIGIISTLAVSKLGNVRERSALRVSIANQKAVERTVGSFLVSEGRLNRLDGLTYAAPGNAVDGGPGDGFQFSETLSPASGGAAPASDGGRVYQGPVDDEAVRQERNMGLLPSLFTYVANSSSGGYLCRYSLSKDEVTALSSRLGLKYVMRHYPKASGYPSYNGYDHGDDGTVPNASDGLDPNGSACIATAVTNGMYVLAVNPMTHLGRTVYQACGQELLSTKKWNENYNPADVKNEVKATGGPLLVFGLGDSATIVGSPNAGMESAPTSPYNMKKYYSRYLLLFRVRQVGAGSVSMPHVEFAGVLDPQGNTIRAAEMVLKDL